MNEGLETRVRKYIFLKRKLMRKQFIKKVLLETFFNRENMI